MRPYTTKLSTLLMTLCLFVSSSCSTTGGINSSATTVPVAAQVKAIQQDTKAAEEFIDKGLAAVDAIQSGKVALTMAALAPIHEDLAQAKTAVHSANTELPKAASSAETDATARAKAEAEVAAAKQADPTRTTIRRGGYASLFGGIALLIAGFLVPALAALAWPRSVGIGMILFGLTALTVEYYLTQIRWVIIGLLVAAMLAGLVWLWIHRKTLAEDARWC